MPHFDGPCNCVAEKVNSQGGPRVRIRCAKGLSVSEDVLPFLAILSDEPDIKPEELAQRTGFSTLKISSLLSAAKKASSVPPGDRKGYDPTQSFGKASISLARRLERCGIVENGQIAQPVRTAIESARNGPNKTPQGERRK